MPFSFEGSKDEVARLVKHFLTNKATYIAPAYKEAHARQEFIDPLFMALNWDVPNRQRAAPDYREVIVEDSLAMEGYASRKAPDYAFRVGRERKFFVEAKKPGVDLKTAAAPAYQLRRYAWSAKLPLSILTDFEELAVYDCRLRPNEKDKPGVARVNYLTCEEYADRWQEVWDVFSREAVWGGSFDQFAQAGKNKRGTSEVDAEFLKEIEGWREALAKNIALRNPRLTIDELNDAVQRLIDRLIFLRMAEDRGVEDYGQLQRLAEGEGIYAGLLALSRKADAKYNSGLFDFSKGGDTVTPRLAVDDKALRPILADLYYPQSPYEFSVLPAEILGNVYEQFLGKVIRLTASHQAKVEEKPEVKKAGGVYYTPAYIVEYIVKNTVGKQIEGQSPKQLKGFRVLDMACGSGSFLLGAYQYLLDYYQHWYTGHQPEKHPGAVRPHGEAWRLTTAEKKRILVEHIFGVDIDRQAVEVTKLSLLLKVLEGESDETLGKQLALLQERALPNLDRNIKCGNSLIGPDYFSGQLLKDDDELRRVNPFDWAAEFPDAMKAGGFDCVIGNPPYVLIDDAIGKDHLRQKYVLSSGKPDLYRYFVECSLGLSKRGGRFGFIIPNTILTIPAGRDLRKYLLTEGGLNLIVNFWGQVFNRVSVNSIILFTEKGKSHDAIEIIEDKSNLPNHGTLALAQQQSRLVTTASWLANDEFQIQLSSTANVDLLIRKIKAASVELASVAKYTLGMQVYHNSMHTKQQIEERVYHAPTKKNRSFWPESGGRNIGRYFFRDTFKEYVSYGEWCYNKPDWEFCSQPRILIREIPSGKGLVCAFTDTVHVSNKAVIIIIPAQLSATYLLGILNSRLIGFYVSATGEKGAQRLFPRISLTTARRLPIRPINFSDPADKARHDQMVMLVEQMLDLHKRKAQAKDAVGQERLQRLIDSADKQIDALVYELYELTAEEIAVVEGANK